jgi:transcriptional regulator
MLYSPKHFDITERAHVLELLRRHPLATLLSVHDSVPFVSHVPLVPEAVGDRLVLHGHVARANPHWKEWNDGERLLAIFHGPDAYVSPACYQVREAVPTWNYAVVHASGPITLHHDSDAKERVLKALIDVHDRPYHAQWDALDVEWREKMKNGIVAFELAVDQLQAKFKLSQNRSAVDRAGVLSAMQQGGERGAELAEWMGRFD